MHSNRAGCQCQSGGDELHCGVGEERAASGGFRESLRRSAAAGRSGTVQQRRHGHKCNAAVQGATDSINGRMGHNGSVDFDAERVWRSPVALVHEGPRVIATPRRAAPRCAALGCSRGCEPGAALQKGCVI